MTYHIGRDNCAHQYSGGCPKVSRPVKAEPGFPERGVQVRTNSCLFVAHTVINSGTQAQAARAQITSEMK